MSKCIFFIWSVTEYKVVQYTDMPGLHDYRCRLSLSMATCTFSVFDVTEAEQTCDADIECKAFVMASQKTWTGKLRCVVLIIKYLKSLKRV